jgi:hypothetical protein
MLAFSCSTTKVYMDYDENADLESYNTYNYFIVPQNGLNDLDNKRITRALDSVLPTKGISKKTIPDFNINFYAETYTVENQNNIGIGIGGGNRGLGGGVSSGIPIRTSRVMIAFTLEFVDGLNKELFWQTVVEARLNDGDTPMEREAFFQNIVIKALEKYPPEPKE